jgi:hypothetical protein
MPERSASCSICGPEPANRHAARWWRQTYFRHHGYYPGYGTSKPTQAPAPTLEPEEAPAEEPKEYITLEEFKRRNPEIAKQLDELNAHRKKKPGK